MSQPVEATLAYWDEHRQQLRQSETQRSVLTNFLLLITSGVSSFIIQQKFAGRTLPLTVLIVGVGLYGALAAAKYHERAEYHLMQARALTRMLEKMGALTDDSQLNAFREAHYQKYPWLHRIRLHWLWTGLHLAIAVYGIVLTVLVLGH